LYPLLDLVTSIMVRPEQLVQVRHFVSLVVKADNLFMH
jgi:hypothetical protein